MQCLKTVMLWVLLAGAAVGVTGCFSSRAEDIQAFLKPYQVETTTDKHVLHPPDEVTVYCSKVPEIHEQVQRIRPDGKITFEGIGEVEAAGKTPQEVAEAIKEKVSKLYALAGDSPVDVRVTVDRSHYYYVLGQVAYAGPQPYTGRDTVLTSLARAQPTVLAWRSRVQVIRPSVDKDVRPKIFEVNYGRMIAHGDTSKDVLLQEGDIIYVPPTVLAAIAMKIEEFVRPIGRVFSTAFVVQRTQGGGGYGY